MMDKYHDLPWDRLLEQAEATIKGGATLYQKFTCDHCGARQTMDVPNVFYTEGQCEKCSHITDLQRRGGGFMAHFHMGAP
jgi:hypothetical protein